MELSDLLAREGHDPKDLPALLSWARARADALLRGLDPDSPVGALLGGRSRHVVEDSSMRAAAIAERAASRESEEDAPADLRRMVTAATTASSSQPAAVEDDPDAGLGGFARFSAILRMNRPYPVRQHEAAVDERPTLARSFALAAERAGASATAEPPTPPTPPPAEFSNTLPLAAINFNAEESGGLVLGIPDEDAAESSGLSDLFDPSAGPDLVESTPSSPLPSRPSASPARRGASIVDDDDEMPAVAPAPITLATPGHFDETVAESLRSRDTPPTGLAAIDADAHPSAPVLRHHGPKKKVVELGSPVARPRAGGSGKVLPNPRSPSSRHPRKPPPPPPPGRRPAPVDEDIQELSRVELIDDLPSYLRDDDE